MGAGVCLTAPKQMEEVVRDSLPGVKLMAHRLAGRLPAHVEVEELVQVGLIGLWQTLNRFDPRRGVKFQTYANRRVQGAMLDYLRSLDWRPRSVRQRSRRLATARSRLEQRFGEKVPSEELAAALGLDLPELQRVLQEGRFQQLRDGREGLRYEDGNFTEMLEKIADPADSPERTVEKEQTRRLLVEAVAQLPRNERMVLSLYYYEQRTMKEIGQLLGVKQPRISQLHNQAVMRLRKRLAAAQRRRMETAPLSPPRSTELVQ